MGFQSKTYSLSDEVVEWLEGLRAEHGSINKGLLAVMNPPVLMGAQAEPVVEIQSDGTGRIVPRGVAKNPIERSELGLEPLDAPDPNLLPCRHCGEDGKIHPRAGAWRACTDCQRTGHFNTSECRRCGEIAEARKKASSPTGVQDESVDYDWRDPA